MYFITCMERLPNEKDAGGDLRTFGYYKELLEAEKALEENRLDMHEYLYDYAVIERIGEGVHADAKVMGWFKYNQDKKAFEVIPKHETFYVNFAIG